MNAFCSLVVATQRYEEGYVLRGHAMAGFTGRVYFLKAWQGLLSFFLSFFLLPPQRAPNNLQESLVSTSAYKAPSMKAAAKCHNLLSTWQQQHMLYDVLYARVKAEKATIVLAR